MGSKNNYESGNDSNSVASVITGTKQLNFFGNGIKKGVEADISNPKITTNSSMLSKIHNHTDFEKVIAQSKYMEN